MLSRPCHRNILRRVWVLPALVPLLSVGCRERLVVRASVPLMVRSMDALAEEEDIELARSAASANLNLLQGALKSDPHNARLLRLACKAFCGYALAFVDETDTERQQAIYRRARDFGFRSLETDRRFRALSERPLEEVRSILLKITKRDVPELFWPAFAWGSWINLNRDRPAALAQLPKVEALMARLLELDEDFFYAGPHLFLATLYASRTKMLGGHPEKARLHFEKNLALTGGRFLLTYYLYARTYAIQTQNRKLCEELLNKVLDSKKDLLPEQRLLNRIARERADRLLTDIDDYF